MAPTNEPMSPLGRNPETVAGQQADEQPADEGADQSGDDGGRPVDASAASAEQELRRGSHEHAEQQDSDDEHGLTLQARGCPFVSFLPWRPGRKGAVGLLPDPLDGSEVVGRLAVRVAEGDHLGGVDAVDPRPATGAAA